MLPLKQIWTTVGVIFTILLCLGLGGVGYIATKKICQSIENVMPCAVSSEEARVPIQPTSIPDETFVKQILGVKDFVGARGQYVTTYVVPNDVYKDWVQHDASQQQLPSNSSDFTKIWGQITGLYYSLAKSFSGDKVEVHLEGEVLMAFDLSKLVAGDTLVVQGRHVTITLDGPYVYTTHIYESRREEYQEQALWLAIWNDAEVQKKARLQQDAELVKVACDKNAKTKDGRIAGSIQNVAKAQVKAFLENFLGSVNPDYVIEVKFQNESCTVNTIRQN